MGKEQKALEPHGIVEKRVTKGSATTLRERKAETSGRYIVLFMATVACESRRYYGGCRYSSIASDPFGNGVPCTSMHHLTGMHSGLRLSPLHQRLSENTFPRQPNNRTSIQSRKPTQAASSLRQMTTIRKGRAHLYVRSLVIHCLHLPMWALCCRQTVARSGTCV